MAQLTGTGIQHNGNNPIFLVHLVTTVLTIAV